MHTSSELQVHVFFTHLCNSVSISGAGRRGDGGCRDAEGTACAGDHEHAVPLRRAHNLCSQPFGYVCDLRAL